MLDLSMIEVRAGDCSYGGCAPREMVEDAIGRMEDQADAKDIKIVHDISKKHYALCDWDQYAVCYPTYPRCHQMVAAGSTISIHAINGGDEVTIEVQDEGPGVPEDQVDRIFERFYQTDASRSGNEGTGLGLAICKHIVEAHDGRIWAEPNSQVKGGHFKFTLANAEANVSDGST